MTYVPRDANGKKGTPIRYLDNDGGDQPELPSEPLPEVKLLVIFPSRPKPQPALEPQSLRRTYPEHTFDDEDTFEPTRCLSVTAATKIQ